MATPAHSHRIYVEPDRLTLTWVAVGDAGAVHLQVDLRLTPLGWREDAAFIGRHSPRRLEATDGYRQGECDLLPDTDSCYFAALDSYGREVWGRARAGGPADAVIFAALDGVYQQAFAAVETA